MGRIYDKLRFSSCKKKRKTKKYKEKKNNDEINSQSKGMGSHSIVHVTSTWILVSFRGEGFDTCQ